MSAALVGAVVLGSAGCDPSPSTPSSAASPAGAAVAAVAPAGPGAGPAAVRAVLWPRDDDAEVGESVELFQTDPVTVDPAGHWAIDLDPATVSTRFLGGSPQFVNVDVMVATGSTSARWSTTAWRGDDGGVWRSEGATAADRVIDVSMDLEALQITLTDSLGEATTSPLTTGTFGPPAD